MEDLDWKLQLKESEVARCYSEVDQLQGQKLVDGKKKLRRLLEEEAALAHAILERDLRGIGK